MEMLEPGTVETSLEALSTWLKSAETRITCLETKTGPFKDNQSFTEELVAVHRKLKDIQDKCKNADAVMKKASRIEGLLGVDLALSMSPQTEAKLEILDAYVPSLLKTISLLQDLEGLTGFVESKRLDDVPSLTPQLRKLDMDLVQLQNQADHHEKKVLELLETYNKLVSFL